MRNKACFHNKLSHIGDAIGSCKRPKLFDQWKFTLDYLIGQILAGKINESAVFARVTTLVLPGFKALLQYVHPQEDGRRSVKITEFDQQITIGHVSTQEMATRRSRMRLIVCCHGPAKI